MRPLPARRRGWRVSAVSLWAVALGISTASCSQISAAVNLSIDATMVLFDVSSSTKQPNIRERYLGAFDQVLEDLGQGGYIAADIIDDNPRAHSSFPIDLKVESCGLLDNSLECEQEAEDDIEGLPGKAERAYGDPTSKGTDIFGALANAEHFLSGVEDARDSRLVVLSDMVHNQEMLSFATERWSIKRIDEILKQVSLPDLTGIDVYVVGAGATAPDRLEASDINWMETFWTHFFELSGASVESYGSTLHTFP